MTKKDHVSPLGPESERGFSDGEGRPILTSIDHPSPSELDKAIRVRDGLLQKRDNAVLQLAVLDEERKELSFEAHTAGGEPAKQLAKLSRTRVELLGDIETYEAALAEAERRIRDAEQAVEDAESAQRAERAIEISVQLLDAALKIDKALATAAKESMKLDKLIGELNIECRCPSPSRFQLESLGRRALNTALMNTPYRLEFPAPSERRTSTELFAGYSDVISNWAARWFSVEEAAE